MKNTSDELAREFRGYKYNCYLGSGVAVVTIVYALFQIHPFPSDLLAVLTVLAGGLFVGGRHFGRRSLELFELAESDRDGAFGSLR
jgi:hypothetical protein